MVQNGCSGNVGVDEHGRGFGNQKESVPVVGKVYERRGILKREVCLRWGRSGGERSTERNQVITTRRSRFERRIKALDRGHGPLGLMKDIFDAGRRIGTV